MNNSKNYSDWEFKCCGGSDETPPNHTQDCSVHPPTGLPSEDAFRSAVNNFLSLVQAMSDEYYKTKFPNLKTSQFTLMEGKRYIRVVVTTAAGQGQRSSYCFIDKTNGNVLKSASWKQPERKHPRGNIYDANPIAGCTPYGTVYLR